MGNKKTISIEVQTPEGISANMLLHMHVNRWPLQLEKRWKDFAAIDGIRLQAICMFLFYKATHVGLTVDLL